MTDIDSSYVLPSSPEDRKKIKNAVEEISIALGNIADKRSYIKDVVNDMHSKYSIPKKLVNKLAKTHQKRNYDEISEESELFSLFYEEVIDKQSVAPTLSNLNTDD